MQRDVSKAGEFGVPSGGAVWKPMRLCYLGSVGELMRMTTSGSKRDTTMGCGTTRKRTGTGTPC